MDVPFIYYVRKGRNGMEDLSNYNGGNRSHDRTQLRTHKITLSGRKTCTITGVNDYEGSNSTTYEIEVLENKS